MTATDDLDIEERLAAQTREGELRRARVAQAVAWLALGFGVAALFAGPNVLWRGAGYLAAGIVAPGMMSFAVRKRIGLAPGPRGQRRAVKRLVIFNVLAVTVAILHAAYVARRLW